MQYGKKLGGPAQRKVAHPHQFPEDRPRVQIGQIYMPALPCRCRAGRTISRHGATCRSAMPRIACRSPDHDHKVLSYRAASVGRAVMMCLVPQSRYLGVLFRFNFEAFLHGMPYRLMHAFGVERGVYHPAARGLGFCDSMKSLAHSLVHGAVHLFVAAYSVGA